MTTLILQSPVAPSIAARATLEAVGQGADPRGQSLCSETDFACLSVLVPLLQPLCCNHSVAATLLQCLCSLFRNAMQIRVGCHLVQECFHFGAGEPLALVLSHPCCPPCHLFITQRATQPLEGSLSHAAPPLCAVRVGRGGNSDTRKRNVGEFNSFIE